MEFLSKESINSKDLLKQINYFREMEYQEKKENNLLDSFKWIYNNESGIKERLDKFIPSYKEKGIKVKDQVEKLLK